MHRLILTPGILCGFLIGCASAPDLAPTPPPPSSGHEITQTPEMRKAQAAGALASKALGTESAPLVLTGKCEHRIADSQLTVACKNVTITASDPSGEEVGSASVEQGKFSIPVEKVEDYFLKVSYEGYSGEDQEPFGPFRPDDNILIRLNQTPP